MTAISFRNRIQIIKQIRRKIKMTANEILAHMNPYHDPRNGQFTSKSGGASGHRSPIKDKPGTLDDAREKGMIGPKNGREIIATTSKTPSGKSQKEIDKFNDKAMKLVDRIEKSADKASGLYSGAMQMAIRGTQGDRASKRVAGLVYERAMTNRKLMNKYVDKLQKMGVKFRSDTVDLVNFQHEATGEGFVKRALASRIADYIIPFYGYLNPSDYKINEQFVRSTTG
jgi:hypothetical protein